MKKLQFVSVIIVLLLFCPFIKKCDGMNKRAEEIQIEDSTAVISNNKVYTESSEPIIDKQIEESKENHFNELKTYFIEESENVFEIACENGKSIIEEVKDKKSIINDKGFFTILLFCLFSVLLIISSLLTLIYSFSEKDDKMKLFNILNLFSILSIIIVFYFSGLLERFGQIKIGFYLLLISNFYMLYLLKQKKEEIQQ